jgi:hypothetical protein
MSASQIVNIVVSGDKPLIFNPNIKYQMLIDSFGSVRFINLNTGDYLINGFNEVVVK